MKTTDSLIAILGSSAWLGGADASSKCSRQQPQNFILQQQAPLCHKEDVRPDLERLQLLQPLQFAHSIWSHEPFCVVKRGGLEYCTHTTANFRNGHGLSVIANPIAADAISTAFYASRDAEQVSEVGLNVQSLPGKGKGLITARPIVKGQTILLDSPRIIASAQFPSHVTHAQGQSLFKRVLDQLPVEDRDTVLSLDMSLGGTDIENVMKTNAFACQIKDGDVDDAYMCLFPSVARINHACKPNAHARFIPRTLLMEIKAVRDIAVGEEISISYGKIELKSAERKKLYRDGWNFTCTCSLCTASSYEIAGSDQRRARFAQLRNMLENLTAETYDAQQIVAWEKEVMELSKQEGLDILLAGDYERLAYVYAGHGMMKDAKLWASKAKESLNDWKVAEGGPNNEIVRVEELLRELGS
ncbi:SET domain-containing protein [Plenodomus tracheiphilus IPT5]|uniref:SET domain-containing protein n=1 Tax=Plenodomus tracheiphilus IPT5 TaxID=1408161 RepID=A0A6A7BMK0_9PLEO|nr:SET domain-containing protein [Plenodomus tracheiphilus IPT5]